MAAITVAELRVGVELTKGRRRDERERFVAAVLDAVSIEPYDLDVAEAHAALMAHVRQTGTPRGTPRPHHCRDGVSPGEEVVSSDQAGFVELPGVSISGDLG